MLSVPGERVWRNVARATLQVTVRNTNSWPPPLMLSMLPVSSIARRGFVRRLLLAPVAAALAAMTACGSDVGSPPPSGPSQPGTETFASSLGIDIATMTKKSDNLYIKDITVGTGAEAITGRSLRMHYTGWLPNGTRFETSVGGDPLRPFVLGNREVIAGWDQGIVGMRVGGKRRLVIGSALAYGPTGSGPIPPNTTLIFDVELVSVQ